MTSYQNILENNLLAVLYTNVWQSSSIVLSQNNTWPFLGCKFEKLILWNCGHFFAVVQHNAIVIRKENNTSNKQKRRTQIIHLGKWHTLGRTTRTLGKPEVMPGDDCIKILLITCFPVIFSYRNNLFQPGIYLSSMIQCRLLKALSRALFSQRFCYNCHRRNAAKLRHQECVVVHVDTDQLNSSQHRIYIQHCITLSLVTLIWVYSEICKTGTKAASNI